MAKKNTIETLESLEAYPKEAPEEVTKSVNASLGIVTGVVEKEPTITTYPDGTTRYDY